MDLCQIYFHLCYCRLYLFLNCSFVFYNFNLIFFIFADEWTLSNVFMASIKVIICVFIINQLVWQNTFIDLLLLNNFCVPRIHLFFHLKYNIGCSLCSKQCLGVGICNRKTNKWKSVPSWSLHTSVLHIAGQSLLKFVNNFCIYALE